jgi:hypothetical protein
MLGQVSNNVTTARAWFDRVSAPGAQKSIYDGYLLDAFAREGVTSSGQLDDAKFEKVSQQLGISTDGLVSAMSGRCPFGGGMQKATAKQQ